MMDGKVIPYDRIIEIHPNIVEAGRDEYHDGDEVGRGAGGVLGHAEPFVEFIADTKSSQRG